MPASPANTVSAAYARGISEGTSPDGEDRFDAYAPTNMRPLEIRWAVDSWTAAQDDHGDTPRFYGADHIRQMRAYWLGRLRAIRRGERCPAATPH